MHPVRVAFVGTGSIAHHNMRDLVTDRSGVTVVAGVDVDATRARDFCEQYAIPHWYTDTAAMLDAEQPDVVHIATPPTSHVALAVQALEAGAWVLCEKPICCSLAEMDVIQAAEKRTGNWCSTVVQRRFGMGGLYLQQLIDTNTLGAPLVALCNTMWYRDAAYYAVPWRDTIASGGVTFTLGIHAIDMLLWLLGEWETVQAITTTRKLPLAVDNLSLAMVRFANGALASIVNSTVSPKQSTLLHIDFERAAVDIPHLYNYDNTHFHYTPAPGEENADWLTTWAHTPDEHPARIASQWTAFLAGYQRGERPPTNSDEARATLEFITALYKSGATGQLVRRGDVDARDPFYHAITLGTDQA